MKSEDEAEYERNIDNMIQEDDYDSVQDSYEEQ